MIFPKDEFMEMVRVVDREGKKSSFKGKEVKR